MFGVYPPPYDVSVPGHSVLKMDWMIYNGLALYQIYIKHILNFFSQLFRLVAFGAADELNATCMMVH